MLFLLDERNNNNTRTTNYEIKNLVCGSLIGKHA